MAPEVGSPASMSSDLATEVSSFRGDCEERYRFNSRWDNILNLLGLLLGVAIVAAGVTEKAKIAAVLGAFVSAIVTAQRAFPFGQRGLFYRVLIGQASNLLTQIREAALTKDAAVAALLALRIEFAQQFPKGTSFGTDSGAAPQPTEPHS